MSEPHRNPVHKYRLRWWFWDCFWTDRVGPFKTAEKAQEACTGYYLRLNELSPDNPPYPLLRQKEK